MHSEDLQKRISDITMSLAMPALEGAGMTMPADNPVVVEKVNALKADLSNAIAQDTDNEELKGFLTLGARRNRDAVRGPWCRHRTTDRHVAMDAPDPGRV